MKVSIFGHDTPAEARAFLDGVEYVNDGQLQGWINAADHREVIMVDEDRELDPDDEELLHYWLPPLSISAHVKPYLEELDDLTSESAYDNWKEVMVGKPRYEGGPLWTGDEFTLEDFQQYHIGLQLLEGADEDEEEADDTQGTDRLRQLFKRWDPDGVIDEDSNPISEFKGYQMACQADPEIRQRAEITQQDFIDYIHGLREAHQELWRQLDLQLAEAGLV